MLLEERIVDLKAYINFESSSPLNYVLFHIGDSFIVSVQDGDLRVDARHGSSHVPGLVIIYLFLNFTNYLNYFLGI